MVFKGIKVEKFEFQTNAGLERAKIENLDTKCVFICAGLGFALSILFFMDQVSKCCLLEDKRIFNQLLSINALEHNWTNRKLANKQHEKRTGSTSGSVCAG